MKAQKIIFLLPICLLAFDSIGQPGLPEMQQARQDLAGSFFSAMDAALVLAAILGLVGAVRIFHHWQMGKPQITSEVAGWFYASLFVILMGAFVRAIFGI